MDAHEAYWFIQDHPKFRGDLKEPVIDFTVMKVNPETRKVDDDSSLNTHIEIWLECGYTEFDRYSSKWDTYHDPSLDCGGNTFEEAIITLAEKILAKYGDYERRS